MRTVKENLTALEQEGYQIVSSFVLPERDWLENYYIPLECRLKNLEEKYSTEAQHLE